MLRSGTQVASKPAAVPLTVERDNGGEYEHPGIPTVDDAGFSAVETNVDLARIIGDLCDADVAALARFYWLGLSAKSNSPEERARVRAVLHARRKVA